MQLENKLRMVPHKLEKAEEDLTEHQQHYDSMMQLRPIKESVSDSFFLGSCSLFPRAPRFLRVGTIEGRRSL